jgi:hypothetical protein
MATLTSAKGRRKKRRRKLIIFFDYAPIRLIAKTPEAVYSVGNWGKDSLPVTNCKLPTVLKKLPDRKRQGSFFCVWAIGQAKKTRH